MLTSSSPASVARLKVSTPRKPWTTVPLAAAGVNVTVIVPDWPGPRLSGVYGAVALTLCAQTSPLLADTAGSNRLVLAAAARCTVPVVAAVNGPVASGKATSKPGASSGAASDATALSPDEVPSTSGSPNWLEMSIVIGTVAWAATVSRLVLVGTSQLGTTETDSGSGTLFTSAPSSCCCTRPCSRASAKKSFRLFPVLRMVMVAVTG